MGEIRSTLDIIMEKTKGLTPSAEEKRAFKGQEMAGKIRGLIQKYLDGIFQLDRLKMEVAALAEQDEDMVKRMIRGESISRIEIGGDNDPVLGILEETAGLDAKSIRQVLKGFEVRLEQEKRAREKGLLESLEGKGISGPAIIPNIQADDAWNQHVSEMRDAFQKKLGFSRK